MKVILIALAIASTTVLGAGRKSDQLSISHGGDPTFCIIPEFPNAFKQAHAVFVGEVVEIIPPEARNYREPRLGRAYTIEFKVEKAWKGVRTGKTFRVESDHGATVIAFPVVHLGEKYLVFADPIYFGGVPQKKWSVISACNRTKLVSKAGEDLRNLDSLNSRSSR